jgi:signal transduction histidine kinase
VHYVPVIPVGERVARRPQPGPAPSPGRRPRLWIHLPDWAESVADSQVGRELIDRYRRWPLAGVLAFRAVSAVSPIVILVQMYGLPRLVPVVVVGVVVLTANLAMVRPLWRSRNHDGAQVMRWLGVDAVIAVALNLWSAAVIPGDINEPYHDVFWFWCMGSVCLWTGWFGPSGGLGAVAALIPVQVAMTAANGWRAEADDLTMIVGRTVWLLGGVLASTLILVILRLSSAAALAEGVRAGRQAEQIRLLRELHDTALQTLEAIGLTAQNRRGDPDERFETIGRAARQQAQAMRAALTEAIDRDAEEEPVSPQGELESTVFGLAHDMRTAGVLLRLDAQHLCGMTISRSRSDALRFGVREALTNVRRHASARAAHVEGRATPDRVEVVVADDGRGFDPAAVGGFGLAQSIVARLQEVGGNAAVDSRPGKGTTVQMWVPR